MIFTPYSSATPISVNAGESVKVSHDKIGSVELFNIEDELKNWNAFVGIQTRSAIELASNTERNKMSKTRVPLLIILTVLANKPYWIDYNKKRIKNRV